MGRRYLLRPAHPLRRHRGGARLPDRPGEQALPAARVDLAAHGPIRLGPYFDLVLTRNTGISYGLFQTSGALGAGVLLAVKIVAVILLWVWLARARDRLSALSLGLIIGGAIGNGIDRLAYGWVADFVYFHITTAHWRFSWYVFNLADVAIVAGVGGLLYESLRGDRAAKRP